MRQDVYVGWGGGRMGKQQKMLMQMLRQFGVKLFGVKLRWQDAMKSTLGFEDLKPDFVCNKWI